MTTDPRLKTFLALAQERGHPYYAAGAYRLAYEAGDAATMQLALSLGAGAYRREPPIRMRMEDEPEGKIVQLQLFEEAA